VRTSFLQADESFIALKTKISIYLHSPVEYVPLQQAELIPRERMARNYFRSLKN
jgi:hypothetical protein